MDFETEDGWLDTMVARLKAELEKQLKAVSEAAPDASPQARAADARTLAALERTLERLSKLERERAAVKEKSLARHDARADLERRLDQRLAGGDQKGAAGKSDG